MVKKTILFCLWPVNCRFIHPILRADEDYRPKANGAYEIQFGIGHVSCNTPSWQANSPLSKWRPKTEAKASLLPYFPTSLNGVPTSAKSVQNTCPIYMKWYCASCDYKFMCNKGYHKEFHQKKNLRSSKSIWLCVLCCRRKTQQRLHGNAASEGRKGNSCACNNTHPHFVAFWMIVVRISPGNAFWQDFFFRKKKVKQSRLLTLYCIF